MSKTKKAVDRASIDDAPAADPEVGTPGLGPGIGDDPETGGKYVELLHRIKVGETTVDRIVLRRPKAKHLRQMDRAKGDVGASLALITALSDQPTAVVDELDAEDLNRIGVVLDFFTSGSRATGRS